MNVNHTIPILQNNENETVTLIALPLQIFQQASQQHSLIVEQNLLFKALPDGTLIIDTNQILNGNNNLPVALPLETNNSEKCAENSEPVILTIQQKNDLNTVVNNTLPNKSNTGHDKEDKNKPKVRYLNSKTSHDLRKVGRPRKDGTKSRTVERSGPFMCKYCDKEFPKWLLYKKHEKTHVNEKKYKCTVCPASFNILSNHLLHLATHNTDDPTCPECGKKFQRIASLKAHLMYHEKEETFYCEECDMCFTNEIEMSEHLKNHGKEKKDELGTLQCKYCKLTFTVQSEYKKHMNEHNKVRSILQVPSRKKARKTTNIDRKHQCMVCQKAFQKRSQIERHMRVHSGEKPYVCSICDRGFSQKGSLHIHMTKHTGIRPHKCALCPAKFSQKGNLRAHILKTHSVPHGGENVFSCSECSCVFKRLGSLNGHMTRNHPKQKNSDIKSVMSQLAAMQNSMAVDNDILQQAIIRSDLPEVQNAEKSTDSATATYVTLADLSLDGTVRRFVIKQRRVDDIRWHLCSYCPKEFKKPSDLVRHLRVHTREKPYECKMCFRSFAVKSTLTTHIKTHTKMKLLQCKYCLKYFGTWNSLNAHVAKHTNQKPHKCSICAKRFQSATHLRNHFQVHLTNEKNTAYYKDPESDLIMLHPIHITSKGLQPVIPKKKWPMTETASKQRPYCCLVCGAGFRKLSHLKQHHVRHTGERPFRCHLCYRNFSSSGVLKSHILTHNGAKPYSCVLCDKNFSTNGSLKRHLESHSNVKPFLCPYCYKDFKTIVACRKHMKTHKVQLNLQMESVEEFSLGESGLIQNKPSELPYPPDLTDSLADDPFSLGQPIDPQNIEEQAKSQLNEVQTGSSAVTQTLRADETGTVVLPVVANQENLTQENMREIEDTLNSQMLNIIGSENFVDASTYVNKINASEPIATTDELVNTLSGTSDTSKPIEDNPFLYHQVIVNLHPEPEQMPMFDNSGIDNILSQVKLQNDSLFLPELPALNMNETNNVLLPFHIAAQPELQQNQLIMLPTDIEQEIQSASLNSSVNLESIDQNLQLKLNAINGYLQSSQNIPDPNIVLANSAIQSNSNQFLNPEEPEDIVHESISHISSIPNKVIEGTILTEDLEDERQVSSILQPDLSETVDVFTCNVCKLQFKSKNDLKVHQCLNFMNVDVNNVNIAESSNRENMEANVQFNVPNTSTSGANVTSPTAAENTFEEVSEKITNEVPQKETKEATSNSTAVHRNQCTYCPKSFRKPSDLQRHIRTHTGERPFKCDECAKSFSLKSTLESHSKVHQGKKEFTCHVCNCLFASKGSLNVHMRLHTGIKPFKCPLCQLKFRTSGHRKAHLTVHYKEALRTGKVPGEIQTRKAKMSELMNNMINMDIKLNENKEPAPSVVTTELPLSLNQIPPDQTLHENLALDQSDKPVMQFEIQTNAQGNIVNIKPATSSIMLVDDSLKEQIISSQYEFDEKTRLQIENLLREKKVKEEEAMVKGRKVCHICQKEFASKYLLNRHNKIHSGEKMFSCSHCSKTFNQKGALDVHVRTHLGSRPFSCPFCSNTFSQSGNLKTHIKRIHNIKVDQMKKTTAASEFNTNDILQSNDFPR